MTKWTLTAAILLAVTLSQAEAWSQSVAYCERGAVCWTDRSGGTAATILRFRAEGGELQITVDPGITTFRFAEKVRGSTLLPSDWLCVQARQRAADGALSAWYLSDTEGICHQTAVVLPPLPPVPPVPPPVPPIPPVEIFSGLTNSNGLLSFFYKLSDCPRGVQQSTGAAKDGQKIITLKCRK